MAEKIAILGSTGSIGTQTLDVIDKLGNIEVLGLTANKNIELIEKQIRKYKPVIVAVMDEKKALELKKNIADTNTKVDSGIDGISEVAAMSQTDTVVTSVVGNIGIVPTFEAIRNRKNIALANKETLVSAGELVIKEVKAHNVKILPVDSEHSAIFQCLKGNENNSIRRIILTASGGPFRAMSLSELEKVTPNDALKHPNWSMGKKITIDSATMMNKGLEVIEAKWLFGADIKNIEVVVHPQSIIHSAVEFDDGAVIAQMGEPDMRVPIQYALTYPRRLSNSFPKIDFTKRSSLTFEKPDMDVFKCLKLAYKSIEIGGTMPAVLNASNEIAVYSFLEGKISFLQIPYIIENVMSAYNVKQNYNLKDLISADEWARAYSENIIKNI